jgi:hypothetical protein
LTLTGVRGHSTAFKLVTAGLVPTIDEKILAPIIRDNKNTEKRK